MAHRRDIDKIMIMQTLCKYLAGCARFSAQIIIKNVQSYADLLQELMLLASSEIMHEFKSKKNTTYTFCFAKYVNYANYSKSAKHDADYATPRGP